MNPIAVPADDDASDEDVDDTPPASARWALALSTAVLWFFVTGVSVGVAMAATAVRDIVDRSADLTSILALIPLLACAAPLLPLSRHWGRDGLVARAALLTMAAGVLDLVALSAVARAGGGRDGLLVLAPTTALLIGGGALYLVAISGLVNRRAVAGGLVGALIVRQLLTAVTTDWQVERVAVTLALALLGLVALWRWRAAPPEARDDVFERRAGGMRLRGALALGALLFLELVFGLTGMAAQLPVSSRPLGHALAMIPPALAWLFVVRGLEAPRHRLLAVAGAAAVAAGLALWWSLDRIEGAVVAHAAALALFGRALAPASGRRLGKHLVTGLAVFALLSVGYMQAMPQLQGGVAALWTAAAAALWTAAAAALLAVAMYLTPKPPRAPAPLPDALAIGLAAALPLLAALAAAL